MKIGCVRRDVLVGNSPLHVTRLEAIGETLEIIGGGARGLMRRLGASWEVGEIVVNPSILLIEKF